MDKSLTNPTFDYSLVDKDTKSKLICYEGELFRSRDRAAAVIIEHGKILHGVQELLANYSAGVFVAWINSVGHSTSSVYRAIEAYVGFGQFSQLGNLEVSAIYALAKHDSAKKKALRLADKGVKVTHAMAKQLIQETDSPTSAGAPGHGAQTHHPAGESRDADPSADESGEDGRTDADGTEPQETAPAPPRNGTAKRGGSPPKRLDRKGYYRIWNDAIGPLVRLVDKIGHGVDEHNGDQQQMVNRHLKAATDEVAKWMGVE